MWPHHLPHDSQPQCCCSTNLIGLHMRMPPRKRLDHLESKGPLWWQRWPSRNAAGLVHLEKWASQGDPSVFMRARMAGSQKGKGETEAWVPILCAGLWGRHSARLSSFNPLCDSTRKKPLLSFPCYRLGNWRSERLSNFPRSHSSRVGI